MLELETHLDEMQIEQKLDAICKSKFTPNYTIDWLANSEGWILFVVETTNFPGSEPDFVDKLEVKVNFNQGNHKSLLHFQAKLIPIVIIIWTVLISFFFILGIYQKGISWFGLLTLFLSGFLPLFIFLFKHISMFNQLERLVKLHFENNLAENKKIFD